MTEVKAKLNHLRVAPRKARLVADFVRGKSVSEALDKLRFLRKKSAPIMIKLIKSAVANAKHNFKINTDNKSFFIKKITVDEGPVMKRTMPRAMGRAYIVKKRTSHINIVLGEKNK